MSEKKNDASERNKNREKIISDIYILVAQVNTINCRAASIARTKLQEAALWLKEITHG